MSFLWLKSLANKMLGFVTSLFGLSSAGGTQPGNRKTEIPNNASFTQTQPTKKTAMVLPQPSSTKGNPLAEPYRAETEKNADYIPEYISNELRTRLDNLKTALNNQDYDTAKTLRTAMYSWAGTQIKGKNQGTKLLLMNFQKLLFGMKNKITNKNCSTLITTLEMLLENDSLPIDSALAKILGELPQLAKLEEAPRKDRIRAIVEGSSKLRALLKNSKTLQEKVAQHPEKWETIVNWLRGGEDLPDNEGLKLGLPSYE